MSPAARALLFAVRVYQAFFSALMPSACKFYPSCSHYAADALRIHGARRGTWLALRRLARCHPFSRGGVDLVSGRTEFTQNGKKPTLCYSERSEESLLGSGPTHREILRRKARLRMTSKYFFSSLFSLPAFPPERQKPQQTEVADPGVAGECSTEEVHS